MIMTNMKKKKILLYLEPSTLIITRLYLLFVNSKYEFLWGGGKGVVVPSPPLHPHLC